MFYQPPELKSQVFVTPIKLNNIDQFDCKIYLDNELIDHQINQWAETHAQAVTETLRIANRLKQMELNRIELETFGDRYYVKYYTDVNPETKKQGIDGFYAVFVNGRKYNISSHVNKEDALAELDAMQF
jgi:hypothetical protein